jgi:hypothetical protein
VVKEMKTSAEISRIPQPESQHAAFVPLEFECKTASDQRRSAAECFFVTISPDRKIRIYGFVTLGMNTVKGAGKACG